MSDQNRQQEAEELEADLEADLESESLKGRVQSAGEQAAGDLANALLDSPLFNQAMGAAFGAREKALTAQKVAMQALDISSASDLGRIERRLRSMSDRLEAVEAELDRVSADMRALRELEPPGA